jgi:hypothetical protein
MSQQITIELTDDHINSLNQYLGTQLVNTTDPITKTNRLDRAEGCSDPETWILTRISELMGQICSSFPSEADRELIKQKIEIEKQLKSASSPSIVSALKKVNG